MGAWSTSITGNDTAQDLKSEYQAAFYYYDVETALQKIDEYVRTEMFSESDEEEWCDYYYSLADFMWRKGILTEKIKNTALEMIDSGFGLEIWAESGKTILNRRKKELEKFREKLLSEQPPRKKIRIDLYMTPIFEKGDIIALQLKTADKYYLPKDSHFSEEFFKECDGKWIVFRKLWDNVSYTSSIVPEVKDIWPIFQLYGKIFDECPCMEQLEGIMIATTNLTGSLDAAFERRFLYKIEFEKPSPAERRHIWQSMLPDLTEEDALSLAQRFDFSGGQIENIARKRIVSDILSNRDSVDLDAIIESCKCESLCKGSARNKIGFGFGD